MTQHWQALDADGRFRQKTTPLSGLVAVQRIPRRDDRGSLERLFCDEVFRGCGISKSIKQINRTITRRAGTLRGLHFQHPPHAEVKIVQCLRGAVFDVALDLRRGSPTFLHWHGELLSAENGVALVIPEGFAHGLQTLEDDTELLYLHTAAYCPSAEDGLSPLDPSLAIRWPMPASELSERDRNHPPLPHDFAGLTV
ncbi:MAG TPA: dTDP-4-dehydrorhamnose 3,5-epimerase family protein [Azospira sp.]|nr:dTDP-4-dehydrorhamnose 3,5-epimerase family protein [Azospira sp.]